MTPHPCDPRRDALLEIAAGAPIPAADLAHLDTCAVCQAELALAHRIERVLATWPTDAPPAHFAAAVAAAARRETWRQEQVVDWGFNVALGVGLAAIATGLVGVLWVVGATAGVDGAPQMARSAVSALLGSARAQAPVVGTATLLLGTTLAAWWWAEERARW
jgi:hypothetical protein